MSATPAVSSVAAVQRRTLVVLVVAQAVGALGITIGIATASLLARDLSGSEKMAGLAQTCQVLGTAVASYLLARLMSARGRRAGLAVGFLVGGIGSLVAVLAGVAGSMTLLLVGALLLGCTTAASNGARYAASDLAAPEHRGRSLSLVVWATTIGAVLGPNLTGIAGALAETLGIPDLTGPFAVGSIGILAAAAITWLMLRPDPLLLARELAGAPAGTRHGMSWERVREVMVARPAVAAATVGLALSHAVMVAVMVMTPLHMEHGGSELRVIGMVISVHVLGMFAFAPLVGIAADRFGRAAVLAAGGVCLLVALLLSGRSPQGTSWQIFVGLFLLGLGWSMALVAASTLIADEVPLDARTDVQGASDLVMGLTAAAAGAVAGLIVGSWGYPALNLFAACLAAGVLASAYVATRHREPAARPVP